jgi:fructosamine-3-kinase
MLEQVANSIGQSLGKTVRIINQRPLSGGSINQVSCIGLDNGSDYLLKTQTGTIAENTFQIEYDSLLLLAESKTIRVPAPLVFDDAFLVMEFIPEGKKQRTGKSKWAAIWLCYTSMLNKKNMAITVIII